MRSSRMIAVDANVISELMKVQPDPTVIEWAGGVEDFELAVPVVVAAEVLSGLDRLPPGPRRRRLETALDAFFARLGAGRVLTLGVAGAVEYAHVMTGRARAGMPMSTMDALIAATCREHGASLATRTTKGFIATGVRLIDPWTLA